ncbi:hypothetical protein J6590_015380 [Homalodisca vitripennis]|nr:hypothetical protein J6590_015380 [Homalodisca vitripennis]
MSSVFSQGGAAEMGSERNQGWSVTRRMIARARCILDISPLRRAATAWPAPHRYFTIVNCRCGSTVPASAPALINVSTSLSPHPCPAVQSVAFVI